MIKRESDSGTRRVTDRTPLTYTTTKNSNSTSTTSNSNKKSYYSYSYNNTSYCTYRPKNERTNANGTEQNLDG